MKQRNRACLIVLEDFPASENRVQREARALKVAGWDVRILAARGAETCTEWCGIPVDRTRVGRVKAAGNLRRLWEYTAFPIEAFWWVVRQAVAFRPHVVQVASMPDWLVFSAVIARPISHSRVVLDLHELMPELMQARGGSSITQMALKALERWSVNAADRVVVPTPGVAKVLRGRIADVEPVVVVNGVDSATYPVVDPAATGGRDATPLVGFHGTLTERFGVRTIIEAMAVLRDRGVEANLRVIGNGLDRPEFEELTRARGLEARVSFLGQIPAARLAPMVPEQDLGLVPMLDTPFTRVAYPTKLLEYAASGVAVVASDMEPIREMMTDSAVTFAEPGNAAAWADAIEALLANRGRRLAQAREAQVELQPYLWQALRQRYVEIFEELVARTR